MISGHSSTAPGSITPPQGSAAAAPARSGVRPGFGVAGFAGPGADGEELTAAVGVAVGAGSGADGDGVAVGVGLAGAEAGADGAGSATAAVACCGATSRAAATATPASARTTRCVLCRARFDRRDAMRRTPVVLRCPMKSSGIFACTAISVCPVSGGDSGVHLIRLGDNAF
ncbi:hypothetical protein GCM10020358_11160 [Amorphoplanes nipponensis]